jgi:LPXTG-site transpeptidase (sortase) family protein
MSNEPLLLSPAKTAVLVVAESRYAVWLRYACIAVGLFVVVWGLADVTSRIATAALGQDALFNAFAPAASLPSQSAAPAAVPTASASTTGALVPAQLKIPALGINAKVEEVGKKADGSMGTPKDFLDVGWWGEGARPGEHGSAVFDGHVNNALTKSGVFEHLSQIQKGDYVTVSDKEGKTLVYRVTEVSLYDTDAPTNRLFAKTGPSQLVLITCDGEWVQDEHSFSKRLVVIAKPA